MDGGEERRGRREGKGIVVRGNDGARGQARTDFFFFSSSLPLLGIAFLVRPRWLGHIAPFRLPREQSFL